ncbi:hypothetical protein Pcinc_043839 [Petrolisthes cinctipes]|uniref:Uncharacterized protein n=1 Tax=Petrolisthes cinctipes TaxID=88211 RepID=A0AAE1BFA3_PETCI|nr:hypothetical protein Pcinc_043839 [Petrolisthes cinctipes]
MVKVVLVFTITGEYIQVGPTGWSSSPVQSSARTRIDSQPACLTRPPASQSLSLSPPAGLQACSCVVDKAGDRVVLLIASGGVRDSGGGGVGDSGGSVGVNGVGGGGVGGGDGGGD